MGLKGGGGFRAPLLTHVFCGSRVEGGGSGGAFVACG